MFDQSNGGCLMRSLSLSIIAFGAVIVSYSQAFAVELTTYAGTLGKASVIVELQAPGEDGAFFGRYAYTVKGIDIPLHGARTKDGFVLEEEKPCTKVLCRDANGDFLDRAPIAAEWSLKPDSSGDTLLGTWTDKDSGKSLPIKLSSEDTRELDDDITDFDMLEPFSGLDQTSTVVTAEDFPYDFLKLDHPMKQGRVFVIGDSAYRMDFDSRVGLDFPTVVRLGRVDLSRLNRTLTAQRLQWVSIAFNCYSSRYLGYGWTGFDVDGTNGFDDGPGQVSVDYLTPRLMGITESGRWYCGGAHEDEITSHIVLDARTGKLLHAWDLLNDWVAKDVDGSLIDPAKVEDPNLLIWGPDDKLMHYVLDHRNERGASTAKDCPTADLVKTNLGVYFKGDKLIFALVDLPTVTVLCGGDLSSMPIKDARPFLTKAGAKYFAELDK
jgi:hypothetical protein